MDVALVIEHRLEEVGLDQRGLASSAQVTESYISQLLTQKKAPPVPRRTDIYGKIEKFLKLPKGELAKLGELQRREELKKKLAYPPAPLFTEVRELVLSKCRPGRRKQIRIIFEKQPFGELERLVTQKLLDEVKRIARNELESEIWLRRVAWLSNRTYEEMRVAILDFLNTDVFSVSVENCVSFLDPLIESWDIDLATFGMEIVLSHRVTRGGRKRFEFVETRPEQSVDEPGLTDFLRNPALKGDASEEEVEFLRRLRFEGKHPTALYYYRELQNLRDPLHFRPSAPRARRRASSEGIPLAR